MLDYGDGAQDAVRRRVNAPPAAAVRAFGPAALIGLLYRNKLLVAVTILATMAAVFVFSKTLTPRYVATAQIYMDPRGLPVLDKDATPATQDSNGYINLVESQLRIITSQLVLDRVVHDEHLDKDPEFAGTPPSGLSSLLGRLLHGQPDSSGNSPSVAAARTLASRLTTNRPERTFVIGVSVSSRDPAKAARIANAVASAYIDVQSSLQSNMARQTTSSLTSTLESMRARVLADDRAVEDFRAAHNLFNTKDGPLSDQQLATLSQQLADAHARTEAARARYEQIQKARQSPQDFGAIAEIDVSPALTALRTQEADARQQLANLSGDLGPLHPALRNARARVAEIDRLIQAELTRVATSAGSDLTRDQAAEAAAARDLANAKQTTGTNDQASVELRELQRQADASKTLYSSFLSRSQETSAIENVAAPSTSIITRADAPIVRNFPPSTAVLLAAGLVLGSLLGAALAVAREFVWGELAYLREGAPAPESPQDQPPSARKRRLTTGLFGRLAQFARSRTGQVNPWPVVDINAGSRLEVTTAPQSASRIDLTTLGLATAQQYEEGEFAAALNLLPARPADEKQPRCVAVIGTNVARQRSVVAINLALAAAEQRQNVMLLDADESSYDLSRIVETALARSNRKGAGRLQRIFYRTTAGPTLVLPAGGDESLGGLSAAQMLDSLRHPDMSATDIVLCDGPEASADTEPAECLQWIDDILLVVDPANEIDFADWQDALGPHEQKVRGIIRVSSVAFIENADADKVA